MALRLPRRDDREGRPYHSEQFLWFHLVSQPRRLQPYP